MKQATHITSTTPDDSATNPRRLARHLYWQGWRITTIATHLQQKRTTVESWKQRDGWDKAPALERIEVALETRLAQLVAKEIKTGGDFKEIDLLMRQVVQTARVRRYEAPGGNEVDLNPNLANRYSGSRKRLVKNDYSEEQQTQLITAFRDSLFKYQTHWFNHSNQRTRVILKSRQIGATWYFAREALVDALQTGRNQIFLSASKMY